MHIAAMKPDSMNIEDLDKKIIEMKKIQRELILNSGKPENIAENLDGKMSKFYSEVTS